MPAAHDHDHDHQHDVDTATDPMAAWRDTDPDLWFTESFWDDRYRDRPIWSGNANQRLVEAATDLAPGRALDVGCGEGGDAIWLAGRGWRVTATDVSTVVLARAAQTAAEAGLADRISWEQADGLGDWAPTPSAYDLVTVSFLQLPRPELPRFHRRLAAAVAPGGTLLITAHHADSHAGADTPFTADLFATADEMAGGLDLDDAWEVTATDPTRVAVLAGDPDGQPHTVRDAVVRAVRLR